MIEKHLDLYEGSIRMSGAMVLIPNTQNEKLILMAGINADPDATEFLVEEKVVKGRLGVLFDGQSQFVVIPDQGNELYPCVIQDALDTGFTDMDFKNAGFIAKYR